MASVAIMSTSVFCRWKGIYRLAVQLQFALPWPYKTVWASSEDRETKMCTLKKKKKRNQELKKMFREKSEDRQGGFIHIDITLLSLGKLDQLEKPM